MAVYNGERFIGEQLESFCRQTRLPDELVVSDDGSTDRSVEIVRAFARHAPFLVRLLSNKTNVGCSKNFERAITACTGDLIFISDWDDVWHPRKLSIMEGIFRESPNVGVAVCDWQSVDENLRPLGSSQQPIFVRKLKRNRWCSRDALASGKGFNHWLPPAGCCSAFRATLKPLILPFPDSEQFRRGDYDYFLLWTIICSGAAGIALVPDKLVDYRRHNRAMNADLITGPFNGGLDHFAKFGDRKLYLVRSVIDRIQSPLGESYCVNRTLRIEILRHWHSRCNLSRWRLARVPAVLKELMSLRYHRFSSGFTTAAKDLLFV